MSTAAPTKPLSKGPPTATGNQSREHTLGEPKFRGLGCQRKSCRHGRPPPQVRRQLPLLGAWTCSHLPSSSGTLMCNHHAFDRSSEVLLSPCTNRRTLPRRTRPGARIPLHFNGHLLTHSKRPKAGVCFQWLAGAVRSTFLAQGARPHAGAGGRWFPPGDVVGRVGGS